MQLATAKFTKNDLAKYPRTPERDEEIARAAGATEVWFPKYEEIYPPNSSDFEYVSKYRFSTDQILNREM